MGCLPALFDRVVQVAQVLVQEEAVGEEARDGEADPQAGRLISGALPGAQRVFLERIEEHYEGQDHQQGIWDDAEADNLIFGRIPELVENAADKLRAVGLVW